MPRLEFRSSVDVDAATLFDWHARAGAFERLSPPWDAPRTLRADTSIDVGAERELLVRIGPFSRRWLARHTELETGLRFVDEQVRGPFGRWRHEHRFESSGERCTLFDSIDWSLGAGRMADRLAEPVVSRMLRPLFAFRHERTKMDIERHTASLSRPMRVAVAGASGLIGTALTAFLSTGGHTVVPLVRGGRGGGIAWDPDRGTIDAASLEGFDVVVNLAGASIADGRWTDARRRLILDSRVRSTHLLASTIASMQAKPSVFISASAIGFYGDRHERVDEAAERGRGFVADVCAAWEAAAEPARAAGVRVVHPRLGIVLTATGGALAKMLPAFRAGLGGPLGSGRQMMSWVALDDVLYALLFAMQTPSLSGPLNVTSPHPVSNVEFGRTLGRVLHRPAVMPLPALAVKTLFGEMGRELLLEGAPVVPTRLLEAGYRFAFDSLEAALRWELGRAA